MIQFTNYEHAIKAVIQTTKGLLPWGEWLRNESERIGSNPERRAEVRVKRDQPELQALFVNRAPGCKCDECIREKFGMQDIEEI